MSGRSAAPSLRMLYAAATRADPYPFYRHLRENYPVLWDEEAQTWFLTRYADAVQVLRDPRSSSAYATPSTGWVPEEARPLAERAYQRQVDGILRRDPPDHTGLRAIMVKGFTPRTVASLRPWIEALVADLLDRARDAGRMDVIADLAYPLPATVIARLLGVPAADQDRFIAWSEEVAALLDADPRRPERQARALAGEEALYHSMCELVQVHLRAPRDDLTSAILAANEERHAVSIESIANNLGGLLFAGHETTTQLIGNGLLALLRHPDQLARLRADPSLVESAVEELLRYDSPVQMVMRMPKEDVTIGGTRIAAGQRVTIAVGAANRDPAQFADPDRLDVARQENKHLAFSQGPHFCLGAGLARLEGQIVFSALARLPSIKLATQQLRWKPNMIFHALESLPVAIG